MYEEKCIMLESTVVYLFTMISGVMGWALTTNVMLKRRHSYNIFIIYILVKVVCTNLTFQVWLADEMAASSVLKTVYICLLTMFAIMSYLVMIYTFDEPFDKIAIISSGCDLFGAFVAAIAKGITDFLNEVVLGEVISFPIFSLLMPFICGGILLLVLKYSRRFCERIRRWNIKHKKLVMTIFFVYLLLSIVSMQMSYNSIVTIMVTSIFFFVLGLISLKVMVNYYYKKAKMENDILKRQQSLLQMQYEAVTRQAVRMELAKEEIKKHMEQMWELRRQNNLKSEEVEAYIADLKARSQEITEGVFCDDWQMDCALCHIMNECRKREIAVSFYLQGYHKAQQSEGIAEKVMQFVSIILDDKVERLEIRITSMKGKVVGKINYHGELNQKTIKELKVYCRGIDAVIEHNNFMRTISVVL